jgi:SpoVK/Ycf46/Vps4 family AAA+-type ATPase
LLGTEISLPPELKGKSAHFDLGLPDKEELKRMILSTLDHHQQGGRITIHLDAPSLDKFIAAFSGLSSNQARQVLNFCIFDDEKITPEDIRLVSHRKARLIQDGGLVEYFPPSDNLFELGGFKNLKSWLKRTKVALNPEYKEKYNLNFPKGLMLLGVQGCGKSLAAKFIARDLGLPLLKLNSGSLYDKYIGETEKNFQKVIKMAETLAPVVLWIDEIEKVLVTGDGGGDDQAVSKRLLGVILSWLQEKTSPIFVVATANQIHALPPELQRKGRFDEIFYVDLPDQNEREEIFRIHLKLRNQNPVEGDLKQLALSSEGYTGSEIEQVIIAALQECLHETKDTQKLTNFVLRELLQTIPLSVSRKEEVDDMRAYLRERYVPVK